MATDGFSQRLNPKYHKLMLKVPQIETNTQELNVSQFLYPRISIQTHMVGLHTADTFSRVLPRSRWCYYCLWGFCLVLHVLNSICSSCEACCSLLSICQALSLSFFLHPPPPSRPSDSLLLPFSLSAPLHIYSSFLHWVDDSLVFESCAFCSMTCSVVSLLLPGLSLFLLLLHPGSQQTLTYVSASHVLISNLTMLLTWISSSPELFGTLLDTPKHPLPLPQTFVSLSNNYILPPHPSSMAGLPGTGPLHARRDRGLTCQPPGEISRVSVTSDLPQNVHQSLILPIFNKSITTMS